MIYLRESQKMNRSIEKVSVIEQIVKAYNDEEVKVIFKKHKNTNEYLKIGNYWIRNYVSASVKPQDVNNFYHDVDVRDLIDNEIKNTNLRLGILDTSLFSKFRKWLIVSDGLGFENHKMLERVASDVCVIVVNQAARFWQSFVFPEYFVFNNPSKASLTALPISRFPKLIGNRKSYHNFIRNYKNIVYLYDSVADDYYESLISKDSSTHIDDYRNPICAAINLAHQCGGGDIFLGFCSVAYKEHRPGTIEIENGIHQYEVQRTADEIVDGNLFWYKFGNKYSNIWHTGLKNSFKFSKYILENEFFEKLL